MADGLGVAMKAWLGVLTAASVTMLLLPVARAAGADWTTYRLHGCSDLTVDAPADLERLASLEDSELLLSLGTVYEGHGLISCSVFFKPYPATHPYPVYGEQFAAADPIHFCPPAGGGAKNVTILDTVKLKVDSLPAAHCATGHTDSADEERPGKVSSLTTILHPLCLYYLTCNISDTDQERAEGEWTFDGIGGLVEDIESRMRLPSP